MKLNLLALLPLATYFVSSALAASIAHKHQSSSSWPHGPFYTSGRDIKNANGQTVTFVGTNWPGSGETMIPEGIEFRPIAEIVQMMKYVGYNFVRHTYPIQMIDQIYENNGQDVSVYKALTEAMGQTNGTRIMNMISQQNPEITKDTTRLEVYDLIAKEEAKQGILMHLDNHISRAMWCCSHTDGNAWFDDVDFDVANWKRGHAYMANWARKHSNIVSMSLRNELRKSAERNLDYNWVTWWGNVTEAAENIHATNSDLLITVSGLDYDIDLNAVTVKSNLVTAEHVASDVDVIPNPTQVKPVYADLQQTKFGKANKAVLELHAYKMSSFYSSHLEDCGAIQAGMYKFGFNALGKSARPSSCSSTSNWSDPYACPDAKVSLPVLLTEFGDAQDSNYKSNTMNKCLRDFTTKNKIGWAHWALAGSYRVREGITFNNDTWGLTTPTWNAFQSQDAVDNFFRPWISDMGTTGLEL
ncbi:glycoside hydrolase [Testicularia cyperi]|uniref:Glycoside hydrolase n=1 Tax=Testicularia cyperi TaxID=1882483 RepID=A0A317XHL1_9BASI|nr:glycoside hydrolase [Testicularia cyperi]